MGYSAGNLELSILGFSDKAVNSVNATAKSLGSLYRVIKKMEDVNFSFAGQKLEALFTKIAKATNSINTTNITNLASAAKSLSTITRIGNLEKMDFEKVGKGFNTLAVAIQPFLDRVKEAEASLTALDGVLKRTSGKKIQGLLGGGETDNKKGGFLGFAKLGVSLHLMRKLGRFMGNLVQAGSDYNETLNLWQVAMRNNLDVADQFVNKMQKAYGISSKTLMNAQAVFKNMIGSLGQISDQTAYALSEALVQMSADYASLYNRTLESAFQNMQSMLAGQVRPIRSAGLDMTENTLFMFYQQLGGTKTMRQLSRTEKQLLSILAVYKQMGSAGALGDMSKTLNQFANQSRMMTEYWAELKTWSGLLLKDLIDQSGMLIKINAFLITTTEIVKAIAKARGIGDENFLTGLFETTDATNDAVDELQGKLLDFDKFRSLEGASASPLAIDEKLLEAITGYSSKIDQAQNAAKNLADTWLENLGIVDANGDGVLDITYRAEELLVTIKSIVQTLGIIAAIKISSKIWNAVSAIEGATFSTKMFQLASTAALYGGIFLILYALNDLTQNWDKMSTAMKIAKIAILGVGVALTTYSILSKIAAKDTTLLTRAFTLQRIAAIGLAVGGIGLLVANISLLAGSWDKMTAWEKAIGIFGAVGAAALAAAAAIAAFQGSWSMGTATVAIVGALAAITAAFVSFKANTKELSEPMYAATGASDIDSGTLFVAGEMGKTEAVYTGSNGKTNVANIQQMKSAYTQSLNEWWSHAKHDIPAFQGVSDSGIYTIVDGEAKRRGKTFSNVR